LNASTNYVISYWSTNGAYSIPGTAAGYPLTGKTVTIGGTPWTYYEHLVTGRSSVQLNGSGGIDELRLYPASAQMKTYTYSPLVGMTSQCDVGNRISYYFYDGLGRLSSVKDQDGNIIKTYQYHYKGQ
jgi:YD repeat-containing protein